MKYCKNCKVHILDDADVCPLCHNVLKKEAEEHEMPFEVFRDAYPDVTEKRKTLNFVMRLVTFLVIAIAIVCVFANYQTNRSFYWSAIVVGSVFYGLWIFSLFYREVGYIRKIFAIVLGGVALVVLIDIVTGSMGWSWNYVLPGSMMLVDFGFLILMIVNHRNWQGYILYQILMIVVALIPLSLILSGVVEDPLVSELAILSAVLLFLGTLIIGGRTARTELSRRFRV